jgi:CO/xanthine dehydrogenase FAD-binding subunit
MWYSIKSIVRPETFQEAFSLQQQDGTTLFAGGSYLLSEKNPSIHTLIDINGLLNDTVSVEHERVRINAGATLQTFIESVKPINPDCRLINGAKASCPSKHIRNQRTFGGEVGQARPNSDALVFLHAVDAEITVYTDLELKISIRDWDGNGIIKQIAYYPNQIDGIELQRFSVLESAPAVVIVGGIMRNGQLEFSIGGTANTIQTFKVMTDNWKEDSISEIAKNAVRQFIPDHFGSLNYKESLIATAVKRVGGAL